MSPLSSPLRTAALFATALSSACFIFSGEGNEDTRAKLPDGGYACNDVAPDTPACCNGGSGCGDALWCDTLRCICDDVEDPCGGGSDAGVIFGPTPDAGPVPTGNVGLDGGSAQRLYFATTGDTRPGDCDDTADYPTAVISQIARASKALEAQFMLDLGDHMYVCNGSAAEAQQQMGYYQTAMALGPRTWFMLMGNHECNQIYSTGMNCTGPGQDANFDAYMAVLNRPEPWYSFDISVQDGIARFVMVADDAWDPAESSWLDSTLSAADTQAKYTIVARHHPITGSSAGNSSITSMIEAHKYTLLLTAHTHVYSHDSSGLGGRSVVLGIGGAPASSPFGFATVLQNPDDTLTFALRDINGNPVGTSWTVLPQ